MRALINRSHIARNTLRHAEEPSPALLIYAGLGIASALFYYMHLFRFPATPLWQSWDETIFLEHAVRMLRGEVLYRDLFQFNLPGTEYLYYFLFRLFGIRLWIAPLALLANGVAITLLLYSLSRKVLHGSAACVPPVIYLVICQRSSFDATHHWYSTMLVLLAIRLTMANRAFPLGLAGTTLGVASLFTTSRGASVAFAIGVYLIWKERGLAKAFRPLMILLAPYVAVISAALACMARLCGTKTLINSVIVFPARYYSAGYANSASVYFDELHHLTPFRAGSIFVVLMWVGINLAVPVILLAFPVLLLRRQMQDRTSTSPAPALVLYWLAGIFSLLPVATAPATLRLICAAAFAYILAATLIERDGWSRLLQFSLAAGCLFGLLQFAAMMRTPVKIITGPLGSAAFYRNGTYEQFSWIAQNLSAGTTLFGSPDADFFFDMKDPSRVPWVEPDEYTRPEEVGRLIATLQFQPGTTIFWPQSAWNDKGTGDHLQPLRKYLRQHYQPVHQFEDGTQVLVPIRGQ